MNDQSPRQLAVILFADIVGYTALMEQNEARAAELRQKFRTSIKTHVQESGARLVQFYGDGALLLFRSARQALEISESLQAEMQAYPLVPVRIGLHQGEVTYDGEGAYGSAVNIAARIESLAGQGGILFSEKLYQEVGEGFGYKCTPMGSFQFKNVKEPMALYALAVEGFPRPNPAALQSEKAQRHEENRLAVLPFANMSSDPENEYFSDGITEEIINALARIENLKVTSRTSSFYFKDKSLPLKEVAEQLGVSVILEGSVRVAGNTIRITAQLIEAREDFHFWSQTWDRKLENIFEIQDEISLEIADKLREQFGHMEFGDHLVPKQTESLDAYEYSLKARYHFNKWNPEDVKIAIELWEKTIALDPKHTESCVGLADAYGFMATTGFMPYVEAWQKASDYTEKALQLNPRHAGAHYQLANISFFTKADYQEAFQHGQKAVELMPNYPEAQQFMSFLHNLAGDKKKAEEHLQLALDIDPFNQETLFYKAYHHYRNEDFDTALQTLNQCLEHNPKNIPVIVTKLYCLLSMGRPLEALALMEQTPKELVVPGDRLGLTCLAHIMSGNTEKSQPYFTQLLEEAKEPLAFQQHSYLFQAYARLNQPDEAFAWLEKAMKLKSSILLLGYSDPLSDPIKSDPRYSLFWEKLYGRLPSEKQNGKKAPLLDKASSEEFRSLLLKYMTEEEPYLNPQLTLRVLAQQIQIHPNQLSWLLNEKLGQNFNEFINHYRVETFKGLAMDPANSHISLIGLAYESGFNSKTVFNTYFKKEVGMTPKEFLKSRI